jgi:putative ABC transport system permease protein
MKGKVKRLPHLFPSLDFVGPVLAIGATYLLRAILYGLGLFDAVSFFSVAGLFSLTALFAAYVPSRRAMRVEPVVAVRYE